MTKATKEKVTEVAEPVVDTVAGVALYAKCAGCHGKDGKIKALGKSPAIAGLSIETLASDLKAYKVGTLNKSGMGSLMKGQMAGMSDSDIDILSAYISSLK
ncbi:MAG: c-type cytochrome [Sulfurovum sp.]|nr:c-type cytochrome [Sulfurovum sp.]